MIRHYFIIGLRSLLKNKFFTFINIAGLSIGLAASILIALFVVYELGYDQYHEKADRIYRVGLHGRMVGGSEFTQTYTAPPLASELKANCPEVEASVRLNSTTMFVKTEEGSKSKVFEENRVFTSDSALFQIFSLPIIAGQSQGLLSKPTDLVITERIARKYFGQEIHLEDIIGKTLMLQIGNEYQPMSVSAIMNDMPEQSHFHIDILASNAILPDDNQDNWNYNFFRTYILLQDGVSISKVEQALPFIYRKNMGEDSFDAWLEEGNVWESIVQPLTSIHLHSQIGGEFEANGSFQYVIIFSLAAAFLLIIASINFINLSTAKGSLRSREVGIKKTIGAVRGSLVLQFLIESVLISLISINFSLILIQFALPFLNQLSGLHIELNYFESYYTLPIILLFGLIIGIVSGLYPALFLTSYKPVVAMQKSSQPGSGKRSLRNFLVVFQFSISIIMIVCTFLISSQLHFVQNRNLGFNKENVIVLNNAGAIDGKEETFKQILTEIPEVKVASASFSVPGQPYGAMQFRPEGFDNNIVMDFIYADWEYEDVYDLDVKQGRFFDRSYPSDSFGLVINAAAAKHLGWDDPVGKEIKFGGENGNPGYIIGILDDHHYASMHSEVKPMVIMPTFHKYAWPNKNFSIRIDGKDTQQIIDKIEQSWTSYTDIPFDFYFMDESYDNLYQNEKRTGMLFQVFSGLTIFIAILGLLGLITFSAEQRTKEIGIRKSMGATVNQIVFLLSKDYTIWIGIGFVIACPIAYAIGKQWLQNFAYHVDISWIWFALSGLLVLFIAWATVSYQSIRAALKNPVEALRYE